ncbi:MAG: hypothetical protein IJX24_00245 [Oscillospiraceae bacterium]|nr:hypothetical protein [Oscillospiraceae bacterium]
MSKTDNWYIVLELEFDPPVTDEAVIEKKIEEKRKFWSSKFNDFKNGRQYKTWVENIPNIKKDVLGTENKRAQLAKEACTLVYGDIDRFIEDIETDKQIKAEEIEKIAQKTGNSKELVAKRAKAKGITVTDNKNSYNQIYDKYYMSIPNGIRKFQMLPDMLKVAGADDLYNFLYSGASLKNCNEADCTRLLQSTNNKRNEFRGNDAISSNGQKLCALCELAFENLQTKSEYDEYALYMKRKDILDNLKAIAEISERVKSKKVSEAIDKINEYYQNYQLAKDIVIAFLETEKIFYEKPENKKSDFNPVPPPAPTGNYSNTGNANNTNYQNTYSASYQNVKRKNKSGIIIVVLVIIFGLAIIGVLTEDENKKDETVADITVSEVITEKITEAVTEKVTQPVTEKVTEEHIKETTKTKEECPYYYQQKLEVVSNGGSGADFTLYEWDDGWKSIWTAYGYVGEDGVSSSNGEYNSATPAGIFDIGFAYGLSKPDTNLKFVQVTPDSIWVDDPYSYYYNCLTTYDKAYDASSYEDTYSHFINGYFSTNIYFENNGDGLTPGTAISNKGSVITICGYNGSLGPTAGCVDISSSDMKLLLKKLDSSKNPVIEIK